MAADPVVDHWETMYQRPTEAIPWEIAEPPAELTDILKRGIVHPCRALDIGCGTGNYSLFLAEKGFDVTGIDCSPSALELARQKAAAHHLAIRFVEGDALRLRESIEGSFGFILDYSLLHHIPLEATDSYIAQHKALLAPGGILLLTCYTDAHELAQGNEDARGKYGNTMYFRTATQIAAAFVPLELVSHKAGRLGKNGKHPAHVFVYRKSDHNETSDLEG